MRRAPVVLIIIACAWLSPPGGVHFVARAPKVTWLWLRGLRKRRIEHAHVLFLVSIIFVKLHIYLATMVANPKYDKVAYTGSYPSFASFYPYYLGANRMVIGGPCADWGLHTKLYLYTSCVALCGVKPACARRVGRDVE